MKPILCCAILMASHFSLQATPDAAALILSPANLPSRIQRQNPELIAARLRVAEAYGRMTQAGRPDNPQLETGLEHNARFREGRFEIGFSQRFPVTHRLRLEKEISLAELQAAEAEVREVERRLVSKGREGLVHVLANRQRRALLLEQSAAAKEFADFLSESAARGEASPIDAGQARLDAASLGAELRQLAAAETARLGELKPLLGMRAGEVLHVSGKLAEPVLPAAGVEPEKRPDYQVAALQAQAAASAVSLEQARRYEDVEAGFFAAGERREDAPAGFENEAILGMRFQFTLPFWNKNEGAIHEAEARWRRRQGELAALGRGIRLEAEAARAEMNEWLRMIREIDGNLLPLAKEQANLAETAFRKGQGEIQGVLRSRERGLQLATARLDALREFHLARIRFDAATGTP